ncbi:MAG: hypothetical protein M0010_23665 [Actinomycetota bacterium]|nr:hypothetical protein [Actinomycetota bacterium]
MTRAGKGVAIMVYTITEIAEPVEYYLVASARDDDADQANLVQPTCAPGRAAGPRPLYREVTWVFCDRCGCSVDTDLLHPYGHHYSDDGDFYCWEVLSPSA